MFRTILVPVDGSLLSERALPYARVLAHANNARLILLRVIRTPTADDFAFGENDGRSVVESYLQGLAGAVGDATPIETKVVVGDVASEILAEAERTASDLIVMSTHGRSGVGRWIYGSVADAVMRHATVPILLIPATCTRVWTTDSSRRILVPLDGSQLSETVLAPAGDLAKAMNAELVLLRVVELHPIVFMGPSGFAMVAPKPELEAAQAYLKEIGETERLKGHAVRVVAEFGFALSRIVDWARDQQADLIALSSHGNGGFTRMVMGSVATGVVQSAGVPVLVVRPRDAESGTRFRVERAKDAVAEEALGAAHDDTSSVRGLVASLSAPDFVAESIVEPGLNHITDVLVWTRLIELLAVGHWHNQPIPIAIDNPIDSSVLNRRISELFLRGHSQAVDDAKRQALAASINSGSPPIQLVALDLIGRRGDRAVISDVIAVLASDDLEVKGQAIQTLGQLGGSAAITALLRGLRAEHTFLDRAITRALTHIGSDAVPCLVDALADSSETIRWHAAEALADIGDPRAIQPLVRVLEDADSAVRWNAARGLANLGEPALIKLLEALETQALTPWLSQGAKYVLRHVALGRSSSELRALAAALDHPTAGVEVPLRAEEAITALIPASVAGA